MNTPNEILLNQYARQCNKEMIAQGVKNQAAHKTITDRYAAMLKSVGFTKTRLLVEIGRINGQLRGEV